MSRVLITVSFVADGPQGDNAAIVTVIEEGLNGDLLHLSGVHVEPGTVEVENWEEVP